MVKHITSFQPKKVMLMGAAPATVSQRVLQAMGRPVLSHLDPLFIEMMQELRFLIQYLFQTKNELSFPIPGPASAAMEACFINLVEPGDTVIICENGLYGERMTELLRLYQANVVPLFHEWGEAVDLGRLREALIQHPNAKMVCAVHGDSSTGVLSDLPGIGRICREKDVLLVVDVVCTMGGNPVNVDEWGIDVAYCNTHKCIGAAPGLAPITISEKAIAVIQNRKTPVISYFMNFNHIMNHWYKKDHIQRTYHHTAPVNSLYALHEALLMVYEEGLEALQNRYHHNALYFARGLEELGLGNPVPKEIRIPTLHMVAMQRHWDQKLIIQKLLDRHNIQISAGLGKTTGECLRLSAMGEHNNRASIDYTLQAIEDVLNITPL